MPDLKAGQEIGGWELIEFRGEGGNAEVWRCRGGAGGEAAVKFLKTRKTGSLRWERFRREVEYVSGLGEEPGVLPVLGFDLPESLAKGERAWYSMPEAIPLATALSEASLREVVEAVVQVARTLAELGERDDAAHRDLKPGNLYLWEERPAVGDFGLLWRPELASVTESEIAGAFSFTAPELFRSDLPEDETDYRRADVYSLAKTLWALAWGQQFALPVAHDPADPGTAVGRFRPHSAAPALDQVIARATRSAPTERPAMAEFADELERWLALATPGPGVPDLGPISEQIREQLAPAARKDRGAEELLGHARSATAAARRGLAPLFEQLRALIPGVRTDVRSKQVEGMLRTWDAMGIPAVTYRETICAEISDREEPLAFLLTFGVMVELSEDGVVRIGAAYIMGHEQVLGQESGTSEVRRAEAGSVDQEAAVGEALAWINERVAEWLEGFHAASSGG